MDPEVQHVAIAVVELGGLYLVGTRKPGEPLAGRAEFPGGKCLPGEEGSACAVRECREETGLDVTAVSRLYACRHAYPHATLELEFWLCRPTPAGPRDVPVPLAPRGGFEWLPVQTLKSLPFPEANQPVLALLAAGPEFVG